MSSCKDIQNKIEAAFDDGTALEDAAVLEHLGGCPDCQQYFAALSAMEDALHTLPNVEAEPGLDQRILARVHADEVSRERYTLLSSLCLAALIIGGLGALWWYQDSPIITEGLMALSHFFTMEDLFMTQEPLEDYLWGVLNNTEALFASAPQFADWIYYVAALAVLGIFLGFNGLSAWNLRDFYRLRERH